MTAGGAYVVVARYQDQLTAARTPAEQSTRVVAVRDLATGETVKAEDLGLADFPIDVMLDEKCFPAVDAALGQVVTSAVFAGEPLRRERLSTDSGHAILATAVGDRLRAMTVEVSRAAGVGGKLRAEDRVDVLVTIRPDDDSLDAKWVTETILQDVRVLDNGEAIVAPVSAADGKAATTPPPEPPRRVWITLELAPAEAEALAMATARGDLHLALRSRSDDSIEPNDAPLVANRMLGIPKTAPRPVTTRETVASPVSTPSGVRTEVIQGATRQQLDVNAPVTTSSKPTVRPKP